MGYCKNANCIKDCTYLDTTWLIRLHTKEKGIWPDSSFLKDGLDIILTYSASNIVLSQQKSISGRKVINFENSVFCRMALLSSKIECFSKGTLFQVHSNKDSKLIFWYFMVWNFVSRSFSVCFEKHLFWKFIVVFCKGKSFQN